MTNTKKDFQKVIGNIRKDINKNATFPKAMMTMAQLAKGQATVNCGGEWYTAEATKEIAETVMNDERFLGFCANYNAEARMERNSFNTYQVRIYF